MANNINGKEIKDVLTLESNYNKEAKVKLNNKYKQIATWAIFFCSFVYGLTSYIIGPALNDMRIKLNTTTDNITIVFGCMLVGYTLGAIINGIIFNFINRQLVLICLLVIMGCALALAPHCPKLGLLFADAGLCGFGAGGLDTAQVVWIIELWAEKSSLYLQGYQFFNALGTLVSSLMTTPFLAETLDANSTEFTKLTDYINITTNNSTQLFTESHIEIPFGIVGSLLMLAAFILLILHFYQRYVPPIDENEEFVCICPEKWKLIYIILGLLTLAPYVGMEVMNFQLMPTFAKNSHLQLSGSDSAVAQSVMAGAFTVLRGISFIISIKYWSEKIIFVNIIAIIAGNIVLVLFETNEYSETVLLIGSGILGSGFSTVFPSVYAFLETQITISNTIGGLFVCSSGLMAAILPTLCGQFIEDKPLTLIYLNLICTSIIGTSFTIFNVIIYKKSKSRILSKFDENVNKF